MSLNELALYTFLCDVNMAKRFLIKLCRSKARLLDTVHMFEASTDKAAALSVLADKWSEGLAGYAELKSFAAPLPIHVAWNSHKFVTDIWMKSVAFKLLLRDLKSMSNFTENRKAYKNKQVRWTTQNFDETITSLIGRIYTFAVWSAGKCGLRVANTGRAQAISGECLMSWINSTSNFRNQCLG